MDTDKKEFLFKEETYSIIGNCMAVHNELGFGFHEQVYQEALSIEFARNNIPFEREKLLEVSYSGIVLNKKYIADFICYEKIIVEVKAVDEMIGEHISQVMNYLKATGLKIGLLANFVNTKLQYQRVVL